MKTTNHPHNRGLDSLPSQSEIDKKKNLKHYGLARMLGVIVVLIFIVVGGRQIVPSNNNRTDSLGYSSESALTFRNSRLLEEHYEKHGKDMGFPSAEVYEQAAATVVMNASALHKTEAEDGDDVYYLESTNEFVIVSTDGYIRTYFKPDAGIDYYNRQ